MSIIYDAKKEIMTDNHTGMVLTSRSGPDYITYYRYFDPQVKIAVNHVKGLPAGTVEFDAEFIYDRAPACTPEGRLKWGSVVGQHLRGSFRLYELYRTHLQVQGNPPEVLARVNAAKDFIQDALTLQWRATKPDTMPIIDIDGTLSQEVRCYIPRKA